MKADSPALTRPSGVQPDAEAIVVTKQVVVGAHSRTVFVQPGLTPLQARCLNLQAATQALDAAGIDYFAVPGMDDKISVLAVNEIEKNRVFKALRRLCEQKLGYVAAVVPAPRVGTPLGEGDQESTWAGLVKARVMRIGWFRAEPSGSLLYDMGYGCEIEFWNQDERHRLIAPRPNRMVRAVDVTSPTVTAPGERFTRLAAPWRNSLPSVRSRQDFVPPLLDEVDFPIDAVYTWVDGSDERWRRRKAEISGRAYHAEADSAARFISRDELRYSLRSLHLNAPWIRNIYLVTDDQVPHWLNAQVPNIRVVSHREIFSDPDVLPCYNSFAIESQLHHIDGLSEHFLYFNDDMFIGRPVAPSAFFHGSGQSKFFLSQTRVAMGPVRLDDTPIDATVKNNRAIIEARFGKTITQCSQHVPYALHRSVLAEMEREFPREFRATMASRFRSPDNLSITYSLHHYYAYFTGRATPGTVRYGYIQLAVPDLADRLERLLTRRDWDTFCLNDAFSTEEEVQAQNQVLMPFLESYFPVPSPYELP